jgi:23S rRNA pseudouridine1911/1915/1917 synthase
MVPQEYHRPKAEGVFLAKKKKSMEAMRPASESGPKRRYEGRVEVDEPGRADRYIAEGLRLMSRSQLKARSAQIFVGGSPAKLSRPLKTGDLLAVEWTEEAPSELLPEDIPLCVVYEDERVIVVDKAQGMVTHPGNGNRSGTLANALLYRLPAGIAAGETMPARAGIVHRLDKDTSGLLVAAKDAEAQAYLAAQFKDRTAHKEYIAVTRGIPKPTSGRIENRLGRDPRNRKRFAEVGEGGRIAVTDYRVLYAYGAYSLVFLKPKTGRTHQLRVHLAGLGTPILGDPIYGRKDRDFPEATLMLHALRLKIRLPGRSEPELFRSAVPRRFKALLAELERRFGKIAF